VRCSCCCVTIMNEFLQASCTGQNWEEWGVKRVPASSLGALEGSQGWRHGSRDLKMHGTGFMYSKLLC
jgi:hypothetical protein